MSDYERFEHFEQKVTEGSKRTGGTHLDRLSPSDRSLLEEWIESCKGDLTDATRHSYKSYVAKAIANPEADLTSDQRSAMRKFLAWVKTRG